MADDTKANGAKKPARKFREWFPQKKEDDRLIGITELRPGIQYRNADACPGCGIELVERIDMLTTRGQVVNYCPNCGQGIDWVGLR